LRIGRIIDVSTKDWPKKVVSVIFTIGCNYRCAFCQNKPLLEPEAGEDLDIDLIKNRIEKNFLIDGVSITGGEPTLQKEIIYFCKNLRDIKKLVSIDTNGSRPEIIERLLPFINRIALDLKAPLENDGERLKQIINIDSNPQKIKDTINIVQNSKNIQFEIRTTYVKKLLTPDDLKKILNYLKKIDFTGNYVIQQYQFSDGVGAEYKELFKEPTFEEIKKIVEGYKKLPYKVYVRAREIGYKQVI